MKSYREKELKNYVIAIILIYILSVNGISNLISSEGTNIISFVVELLNLAIVSSSIYSFVFILDSIYSGKIKMKLVYLVWPEPGQVIFEKIKHKKDMRFSITDVETHYKDIYDNLPEKTKERHLFENQQWYKIYHQYKTVDMVAVSGKDYRLCRDIYIATINITLIYLLLCTLSDIVIFNYNFILLLLFMLIFTNIAARNKGHEWVYNAIAYDITEHLSKHKS